jgi:hypothetical protein
VAAQQLRTERRHRYRTRPATHWWLGNTRPPPVTEDQAACLVRRSGERGTVVLLNNEPLGGEIMGTYIKTTSAPSKEAMAAVGPRRFGIGGPIAGLAFVVLMVVGSMLIGDVPLPDAPAQEITEYLADSGRHTTNLIGAYFWVLGALSFLLFLVRLRNELRRAEGGQGTLSNLAFGAGVAFSAVWLGSAAAYAALPYSIALRGAQVTDIDLVRVLPAMGRLALLLGGGFSGALVLLAAAVVIFRTAVFPRWLAWLGIIASIALLFDVVYINITPFWAWVGVASVVMLVRRKSISPASVA